MIIKQAAGYVLNYKRRIVAAKKDFIKVAAFIRQLVNINWNILEEW